MGKHKKGGGVLWDYREPTKLENSRGSLIESVHDWCHKMLNRYPAFLSLNRKDQKVWKQQYKTTDKISKATSQLHINDSEVVTTVCLSKIPKYLTIAEEISCMSLKNTTRTQIKKTSCLVYNLDTHCTTVGGLKRVFDDKQNRPGSPPYPH